MDRREFLGKSAAALAAAALSGRAYAGGQEKAKRVALIGCGWYGKTDLYALCQVAPVDVVALCDVDKDMLSKAAERVATWHSSKKMPRLYGDYRQLLKDHELDIVLVGTPDHWHALPMIAAVQAGADVYCQKPISLDVVEGQAMLAAARKHRRVVQIGTQRRSTPHLVEARNTILKEGKLGKIGHVEVCCYYDMRRRGQVPNAEPPPSLDFEMWCGPAPKRPYNPLLHPLRWRVFNEYGNGIMGDMCVHMLDMVRWMLDLGWPRRISSSGGIFVDKDSTANIPDSQTATFEYPEFNVVWNHRTWGAPPDPKYPWAATIYGEKGTLKASVAHWDFIPFGPGEPMHREVLSEFEKFPQDEKEKDLDPSTAPANRRHQQNFLQAIQDRGRPVADIEQGHISSASCILANLSMTLGRTLTWDSAKHEVAGDDEANRRLRRPYRAPWNHPEPDGV
jgi:predicted dehydrogenase